MEKRDIDMSIVRDILHDEFDVTSLREHVDTVYIDAFLVMYTERTDGTGTRILQIKNSTYNTYSRNKKIDALL